MRTRLSGILAIAGMTLIALPGCVSSKKYKASQAELARVRDDSTKLAQQYSTCTVSLQSAQQQNTTLQKSLDENKASYTAQQSRLDTYQGYFSKQQEAMGHVSQELKDNLQQAGLTESDMQQSNGLLYVSLDENKLFKKNTTTVTRQGNQMLNGLATVLKSHDDINVGVDNGYTASGSSMASSDMNNSSGNTSTSQDMSSSPSSSSSYKGAGTAKKHSYARHHTARSSTGTASSGNGTSANGTGSNATAGTGTKSTPMHKRATRRYSGESSSTWATGMSGKAKSAWTLKAARVNTVASHLLKNGVPRVAIIAQRPPTDGSTNNGKIRVIVQHNPGEFTPPSSGSTTGGSTGTTTNQ